MYITSVTKCAYQFEIPIIVFDMLLKKAKMEGTNLNNTSSFIHLFINVSLYLFIYISYHCTQPFSSDISALAHYIDFCKDFPEKIVVHI